MKDQDQIVIDGLVARIRELEDEIRARDFALTVTIDFIVGYGTNKQYFFQLDKYFAHPINAFEHLLSTMVNNLDNRGEVVGNSKLKTIAEKCLKEQLVVSKDNIEQLEDVKEPIDKILSKSVRDAEFTARTTNYLLQSGINTVGDIVKHTRLEIRQMTGMGRVGLEEIRKTLSEFGLSLKEK